MNDEQYRKAHRLTRMITLPLASFIILMICFLFFYDPSKNYIPTLLAATVINLSVFFIVYLYVCPYVIKRNSLSMLLLMMIGSVGVPTSLETFLFSHDILHYPYPINHMTAPLTFQISVFTITSCAVFYSAWGLILILDAYLLSHDSYLFWVKGYQTEISSLRLQLNPQYLSNALNNLQDLIHLKDKTKALQYNQEVIELLGGQLKYVNAETIHIQEEISWIEYYLQVEKNRLNNAFDYTISLDSEQLNYFQIPPMLLQPLVENRITHGFHPAYFTQKGSLNISLSSKNPDTVCITVKDNGVAHQRGSSSDTSSISMSNVERRIKLINELGKYNILMQTSYNSNDTTTMLTIMRAYKIFL